MPAMDEDNPWSGRLSAGSSSAVGTTLGLGYHPGIQKAGRITELTRGANGND